MAFNMDTKSALDMLKREKGADGLKAYIRELNNKDNKEVINLLNDESLHFSSLYILKPEIEASNLTDYLSPRNKIAIGIINEIMTGSKNILSIGCSTSEYIQMVRSVLKWIIVSGFIDDGFEDDYDKLLDAASALLVMVYGDTTVLPVMADAIFERNRKGYLYNDLVWAFFESRYPYGLILIASRLLSEHHEDVILAQKLLSFIPGIDSKIIAYDKQHSTVMYWLEKNYPFLCFTGESFQQYSSPKPYRIVIEAKYLCKPVCVDTGKTIEAISKNENKLLKEFSELDKYDRIMISNYSLMLHNNNIYHWNIWIHRPTAEQVKIAGLWMGGAL